MKVLPDVNTQVVKSDSQWNYRDCCFGMCNKADSVDRSGICLCWDFLCWLVWGYRVSCLTAIVIKDRSHGIDLYTDGRRVCTSGLGLVGDPMTPSDVIPVYAMMNGNFKGGLNNVMPKNKGPVDGADWSDERSVGVSPVGDVRIEYIGDAFSPRTINHLYGL